MINYEAGNPAGLPETTTVQETSLRMQQRFASPCGEELRTWLSSDLARLEEQFAEFVTASSLKRSGRSGSGEGRSSEETE